MIVGGSEKNYRPSELFGDANSYAWQRMYGELHMDNWPVTQAKDGFDWHNSGLEEAFIEALSEFTQDYRKKSESIRVRETINTKNLVETATRGLTNSGTVENVQIEIVDGKTSHLPPQIENVSPNEEKHGNFGENPTGSNVEQPQNNESSGNNNGNIILEGGKQIKWVFKYKNIEYVFHIILDMDNPTMDWLLIEQDTECDNTFTLFINMRHSFFKPLIDKSEFLPIMMKMAIALVIAEIESMITSPDGRIEPSAIRLKMNEILEAVRKGNE